MQAHVPQGGVTTQLEKLKKLELLQTLLILEKNCES